MNKDDHIAVKICGIATAQDYDVCHEVGVDFVGMVFHPASPRHLDLDAAAALAQHIGQSSDGPHRVALCVDMDDTELGKVVDAARPDFLQLHGSETPQRAAEIKRQFSIPVIKAIGVSQTQDLEQCQDWRGIADWLLLDAKGAGDAPAGGGGKSFDWEILGDVTQDIPWMLAGGLHPDNVARAVGQSGARAVDVSSGVESEPGKKDAALIRAFVNAARLM